MKKDLHIFLQQLEGQLQHDFVRVEQTVSPAQFEVTALLQHLEEMSKFPALFFEKPLNLKGEPSRFPLLSNFFATRERCALSLGMSADDAKLALSLEYAKREEKLISPVTVSTKEAPVKEVVTRGDDADLYEFPVVRHHAMDPAPYIDMTPVMKDPEQGFYNLAFLRNMVKGPRRLGIHMSPRHNCWRRTRSCVVKSFPARQSLQPSPQPITLTRRACRRA